MSEATAVILILGAAFVLMYSATLIARKKYPGKLWLGILLCLLCGPVGQLYLSEKVLPWFAGTLALTFMAAMFIPIENLSLAVQICISPMIMSWRMRK